MLALLSASNELRSAMLFPWHRQSKDPGEPSTFIEVPDAAAVEALLTQTGSDPIVLLIHDPACGISARAFRAAGNVGGTIHLVVTGDGLHLSSRIEELTGVRHESPQAFVLAGGRVQWSASHFQISRGAILDAIATARSATAR
jgi:monothiol bacilliredoxin